MPVHPAAALPEPSPHLQQRYRLLGELGRGAMGIVYRALDLASGEEVALKFPTIDRPEVAARCLEAARGLADLSHPNVVGVLDSGIDAGRPYVVMELVQGTSLLSVLEKSGRLEVGHAVALTCQVLEGLAAAHVCGVTHRDVKPENVLVVDGTQARLVDFGLAFMVRGNRISGSGRLVGTPAYMAPEYVQGSAPDARADVYSVGVMLFELLTGRVPFLSENPMEVLTLHVVQPAPRVSAVRPDVPRLVDDVVARTLSKNPAERPGSATQLAELLRHAIASPRAISARTLLELEDDAPAPVAQGPGWVMGALLVGAFSAAFSVALVMTLVWVTGAAR